MGGQKEIKRQLEQIDEQAAGTNLRSRGQRERKADAAALKRERKLQKTMLDIKKRYGKNAILKGMKLQEGATARERNKTIGGHRE